MESRRPPLPAAKTPGFIASASEQRVAMNDRELVLAFARGEEQALESIIKKYFPLVYGAAVRQLGDRHLAEDVAQSVFILLSRKASGLPLEVSLVGWLLRATRFVARDVMKQRCRRLEREEQ